MKNIAKKNIVIHDMAREELDGLSVLVSNWQQNNGFMRFLKETPMTPTQNLAILQKEFDIPQSVFKSIKIEGIQDIVWFLLFHCFDAPKKEIELWFRIDPSLQQRGICTQAVKQSIAEVLSQDDIDHVVWWHSAWNRWSFWVFRKSGFQIVDFIPDQTFLPNIGKITDDFKRQISKGELQIHPDKKDRIQAWLEQHDLNVF
jgi:RimJ/RimL family protein N-acetyltransferase